jgi:adhesin HecA-like repeat protein
MENRKFIAAFKACIAKIAAGGMGLRVTRVDNPGGLIDGANSQSSRSLETMLELCIVQDGEGKPAIRLIEEKPYKAYAALLTQTGTSAPVATILQNEIGELVWSYAGVGLYAVTLAAAFTVNKTSVLVPANTGTAGVNVFTTSPTANAVNLFSLLNDVPTNALLTKQFIEIRVYR